MNRKRRRCHSVSPSPTSPISPNSAQLKEFIWQDKIRNRCILAAKRVSESNSKENCRGATAAITELMECMKEIEKRSENGSDFKYLQSLNIATKLYEAVTNSVSTNQLARSINSALFSEVAQLAQKWFLEYGSDSKDSVPIFLIGQALQEWNKILSEQSTSSTLNRNRVRVTTNFVSFPEKVFSQKSEWYGSLKFVKLEDPYSKKVTLPLGENRLIRHATSTENSVKILQTVQDEKITIRGKKGKISAFCPLVWSGVKLTDTEIAEIPQSPRKFVQQNRYGGVIFEFPIKSTRIKDNPCAFIFGTRKYPSEYSQAILIPESDSPANVYAFEEKDNKIKESESIVHKLDSIPNILEYEWEANYNMNGDWTHPELVFIGDLQVSVRDLKIRFADHCCISLKQKTCIDCRGKVNKEDLTRQNFEKCLKEDGVDICKFLVWNQEPVNGHPRSGSESGYYTIR